MTKILVGCDPEVFVQQNGKFKSAFGLIKGDKKNPQKVPKGAVQVDGMALEFNIEPAATEDEFALNVNEVYNFMKKMVPDYNVVATPVAHFTAAYMKKQPPEALELGCDPDFNAWTGLVNDKPDAHRPMRTASGHVHIGWTAGQVIEEMRHQLQAQAVARQMDFYLGLPSLFWDDDQERREMYGTPGCHRVKPYGVEYRTLSNAWLNSEKIMRLVFRNTKKGVEDLFAGKELAAKYGDISAIILSSDKKEADKILKAEGIEVCYG